MDSELSSSGPRIFQGITWTPCDTVTYTRRLGALPGSQLMSTDHRKPIRVWTLLELPMVTERYCSIVRFMILISNCTFFVTASSSIPINKTNNAHEKYWNTWKYWEERKSDVYNKVDGCNHIIPIQHLLFVWFIAIQCHIYFCVCIRFLCFTNWNYNKFT